MFNTQIQLASGLIDVNVDFPITISFNDITKRGSRWGGYANTIEVKGSANNRRLLGMYFDVDLETETFNRKVKTECSIIQNDVEVFQGFIQLMSVQRSNRLTNSNEKEVVYTVFVFDETVNFFVEMGNKELTDLDFTNLNHTFNRTNIIDSWSNTEGYIYPQFAKADLLYTVRDFKPAIFEWEYFKRIFESNGYSFNFPEAFDADIRMDKRIVPFNGKVSNDTLIQAFGQQFKIIGEKENETYAIPTTIQPLGSFFDVTFTNPIFQTYLGAADLLEIDEILDTNDQHNTTTNTFTNLAQTGRTLTYNVSASYEVSLEGLDGLTTVSWEVNFLNLLNPVSRVELYVGLLVQSLTDVNKTLLLGVSNPFLTLTDGQSFPPNIVFYDGNISAVASLGLFNQSEEYQIAPIVLSRAFFTNGETSSILNYELLSGSTQIKVECGIELNNLKLEIKPDLSELVPGIVVPMSAFVPQKIKQRDFITTIARTYNLFFIADEFDNKKINVLTRDKYIDDAEEWDWTKKFDEINISEITFIDNEVEKTQVYTYKEDKDAANTSYQSEILRVFGDARVDLDNEYSKGENVNELIYSPTPSIYASVGQILPAINGVNPDCNIRVLLNNGVKSCTPYQFYEGILPDGNFIMVDECLHTSMFDDDIEPNFSICFDSPMYLFHPLQASQTDNYLYNLHHQREVSVLNDGKMLVAYFDLTEMDIQKLSKSLQYKVFIQDNGWFYINKIDKYNAANRTLTRVELITLDDFKLKYLPPPASPPTATQNQNQAASQHLAGVNLSTNIWTVTEVPLVMGLYNFLSGTGNIVMGSRNFIQSNNNIVMGNRNTLLSGSDGSRILGDATRIAAGANIVGGRDINRDVITLDIETTSKHREFVAAYDFIIESITYLTTTTTTTIEVNSNPYTFGQQITLGDVVRVEVVDHTTLNLNIYR